MAGDFSTRQYRHLAQKSCVLTRKTKLFHNYYSCQKSLLAPPAALQVCSESRYEVLKFYRLECRAAIDFDSLPTCDDDWIPKIYINFEVDTIFPIM